MTDFDKSIGRGRRLQFAVQQINDRKKNDLQRQLHMAGTSRYTNESIENFCNQLADKYNNEDCSGFSEKRRLEREVTPTSWQPLPTSQFKDGDESDIHEISNKNSCLDLSSSRQSPNGLNEVGRNAFPDEHHNFDCEDDVDGSYLPYDPFNVKFNETSHETNFLNCQINTPPPKVMGRGEILKRVTKSLSGPGRTLQNEIESACGPQYSNQNIEKFVQNLAREYGDKN